MRHQCIICSLRINHAETPLKSGCDTVKQHPGFVGTKFFGILEVTEIPAAVGLPFDGIHSLGSNLMIGLASLHVLAALKHQFVDKNGLLRRMLP